MIETVCFMLERALQLGLLSKDTSRVVNSLALRNLTLTKPRMVHASALVLGLSS